MAREHSGFAQPLVSTHRQQCLTGSIRRGINGLRSAIRQEASLHMYHDEKGLMRALIPHLRNQEEDITTAEIDDPMEDTAGMIAAHRDLDLLAAMPIASGQWWGFGDDRLIQHQHDRVSTSSQPPCKPPFAWRQVAGRRARRWRGRFHRSSKCARARLTLGRETTRACASCRYWVSKGAVHTVER